MAGLRVAIRRISKKEHFIEYQTTLSQLNAANMTERFRDIIILLLHLVLVTCTACYKKVIGAHVDAP